MNIYDFDKHFETIGTFKPTNDLTKDENDKLSKIGIFIINVTTSKHRREKFEEWIHDLNMNVNIFKAFDGTKIQLHDTFHKDIQIIEYDNSFFLLDYTRKFDHEHRGPLGTGMIGDAMSHLTLYNYLQLQNKYDSLLIMEDDVCIKDGITVETIRKYLSNLPENYDFAYLNSEARWFPLILTEPVNDYYNNTVRQFVNAPVSYAISKKGAAKLIAYCRNDITKPPDDLMSNGYITRAYDLIASNVFLFSCDYSFESDTAQYTTNL